MTTTARVLHIKQHQKQDDDQHSNSIAQKTTPNQTKTETAIVLHKQQHQN